MSEYEAQKALAVAIKALLAAQEALSRADNHSAASMNPEDQRLVKQAMATVALVRGSLNSIR